MGDEKESKGVDFPKSGKDEDEDAFLGLLQDSWQTTRSSSFPSLANNSTGAPGASNFQHERKKA